MQSEIRTIGGATMLAALALTVATLTGGCGPAAGGYSAGGLYPEGIDSVAVPVFVRDPDVFRRGWEDRLTEAVIKRIELETPYKVTGRQQADTLLEGRLVNIRQRVLSYGPDTRIPRQQEVELLASFTWKDLRTGRIIASSGAVRATGVYTYDRDSFDSGAIAAVNDLATRLVQAMEQPW